MKEYEILHKMIEGKDSYGNEYVINPKSQHIGLILKQDHRPRIIGKIQIRDNDILYVKYEEEAQRFKKTDAWSINWHVARNADYIYFLTEKESYKISIEDAKKYGEFKQFSSIKELKLYVPVKYWTKKSELLS